ncbi:unnamed protein product [Linum tenue]|uniref:DUF7086 domain-containing protein n=3 Tax=Linum tenue TaxID=586396 RepID=A0AAV0GW38_9ROSI|nr:unnamed protein product [Linum tenue]
MKKLDQDDDVSLTLALSLPPPLPPPPPPPPTDPALPPPPASARSRQPRSRPNKKNKTDVVEPPYPWATSTRAKVHTLAHLLAHNVTTVTGEMRCKSCEATYDISYDLREKFVELGTYIVDHMGSMHHRAPERWKRPALARCERCGLAGSARPVVAARKKRINWLFLLLGEFLGFLTLEQLRYFCRHAGVHRTGAKDRLLYLTYLGICRQLDPHGPFGSTNNN